jgi:hypothetical protein
MTSRLFITFSCLFLIFGSCLSAADSENEIGGFMQENSLDQIRELERLTDRDLLFADDFNDFPMFEEDIYELQHHSSGRAFLYSLMLPGAGQLYTNSKLKAAFFLGIEVFSWYQYYTSYTDGQDLEDEYEAFAKSYWDVSRYQAWLVEVKGVISDDSAYTGSDGFDSTFTHHLPQNMTQQYYEMIGKYDQFLFGWKDTDYATGDNVSDARQSYLDMRAESNSKFDTARNYAIVSIANRIISGFEAAFAARRLNKKTDRLSQIRLKAKLADYYGERIPKLEFTYKFY